jgi:hypothetical protein
MDIEALQFESCFSLPPNSLGYCGKNTAAAKFKRCIIDGKCEGVSEEIKKFIVLYPYLKTIAQISKLPVFSYQVIESYWLGNDLLKQIKPQHYDLLLRNFEKQGVPDFFIQELREKQPKEFIPNHLFHVLHVGVGKASGAVPFNLESINQCMIRWGRVKKFKVQSSKFKVELNYLDKDRDKFILKKEDQDMSYNTNILGEVHIGDTVVVHWGMVIKILTAEEEKKLEHWTKEVLKTTS